MVELARLDLLDMAVLDNNPFHLEFTSGYLNPACTQTALFGGRAIHLASIILCRKSHEGSIRVA